MDAQSKRESDCFSTDFYIEGIKLNKISFVDDQTKFEVQTCEIDAVDGSVSAEVFEKSSRLNYKVSKCKKMSLKKGKKFKVMLDNEEIDEVDQQVYLGTIVSRNGERMVEMKSRISKTKSVANEIVQICKMPEMSRIRLQYVKILINACLDGKLKYGCALWNVNKCVTIREDLDKMKPSMLKRVLEIPSSTPSAAVQYEFGIIDLSLDILMEKLILAVQTLNREDTRVAKQLLKKMLVKDVPGFCRELTEACCIFKVNLSDLHRVPNVRKALNKLLIKIQQDNLLRRMLLSSKMDKVLLSGFEFDGSCKSYLLNLNFDDARVIFLVRYKMLPTKSNFPGWWKGTCCNICGLVDADEHVFSCPGYSDLMSPEFHYYMFWDKDVLKDMALLKEIADKMKLVIQRMDEIQKVGV